MRVKRFTPQATDLFNLIDGDAGRPIEHISQKFAGADILDDARRVLEDLRPLEREVSTERAWYFVRTIPYRTVDNRIEGVVMTFQDITTQKVGERLLDTLIENAEQPMLVIDQQMKVILANSRVRDVLGYDHEAIVGTSFFELGQGQWGVPAVRRLLAAALGGSAEERRIEIDLEDGAGRRVNLTAWPSTGEAQAIRFAVLSLQPIEA